MLTGIHFLLTYACNFSCDHCFLYCGPSSKGTFTLAQLSRALDEAKKIGTVDWIYFEGGEPFLYFPLLLAGIRKAKKMGFKVGVVTNAYPATTGEDARLWFEPLAREGIDELSISDDLYHNRGEEGSPAKVALVVARELAIPVASITIASPQCEVKEEDGRAKGEPVVSGGPRFRGRAVEKLAAGLPRRPWREFTECPCEDLAAPERVHLDSFGNVHLCQGLSMGNIRDIPLATLVSSYRAESHPICGPLVRGGPAQLARELGIEPEPGYIDACHFCFTLRRAVLASYPDILAPGQVYGVK